MKSANMDHAIALLKEKGYKLTDKRLDLLEVFLQKKKYLSAKDVQEALKGKYNGISFDTIYRNLSVFVELGLLEETEWEGERKFRYHCESSTHHHHVICLSCGKSRTWETCPMESVPKAIGDFQITGHKFEIYGYCSECEA